MGAEVRTGPTIRRGEEVYPLIGSHAMREGNRWSVFVLSRKVKNLTPVTLHLPFSKARKITLHRLTGDPQATNRERMNVTIESQEIPAHALQEGRMEIDRETGGEAGGIPAGSIYLYVFEGAAESR